MLPVAPRGPANMGTTAACVCWIPLGNANPNRANRREHSPARPFARSAKGGAMTFIVRHVSSIVAVFTGALARAQGLNVVGDRSKKAR